MSQQNTNKTSKTLKTFSFMVMATVIGKGLGLARTMLLNAHYEETMPAQAFSIASELPMTFFELALGAAVTAAFIPVFNDFLHTHGKKRAFEFMNNFINIAVLLSLMITVIGMVIAPFLVQLSAPGYQQETMLLTVELMRIMFPMMIFAVVAFIFVGMLQSFDEFNIPAAISIISNLILIIYFVFLEKQGGVYGLAVAMVFGWFLQMAVQIPYIRREGYRYQFILNFKGEGIKKVCVFLGPILVSSWVQPICQFIYTRLGSYVDYGRGVPRFLYVNKLYLILVGIFTLAIGNLIFPSLSRSGISKEYDQFKKTLSSAIHGIMYIMIPLAIGAIVFREEILVLYLEHGNGTYEQILDSMSPFLFLCLGMLGFGIREVMNKAFYSVGDAKTPMKIAIIGITINIMLAVVLINTMELSGLALASSISITLIAIMLIYAFNKKKLFVVWDIKEFIYLFKIMLASLLMGGLAYVLKHTNLYLNIKENMIFEIAGMLVIVVICVVFYFALTYFFKIEETKIVKELYRKIHPKKG